MLFTSDTVCLLYVMFINMEASTKCCKYRFYFFRPDDALVAEDAVRGSDAS